MIVGVVLALACLGPVLCQEEPVWADLGDYSFGIAKGTATWHNAETFCRKWGGALASVLNADEREFLEGQAVGTTVGEFWIGLNKLDLTTWKWSDQEANVPNFWADGYPSDGTTYRLCAAQSAALWQNHHCDTVKGFACKANKGVKFPQTPPTTPQVGGYCPSGYIGLKDDNKCFKMNFRTDKDGLTWDEARDRCRAESSLLRPDIATVDHGLQAALLTTQMVNQTFGLYIGLRRSSHYDEWRWADNAANNYENWGPGEPSGYYDNCAEIWYSSGPPGTWNNINCDDRRGYVCQAYKDPQNIAPSPNPRYTVTCKDGWTAYEKSCYKMFDNEGTWEEHEANCVSNQAHLASIHNEAENAALQTAVYQSGKTVWIGFRDFKQQGGFEWSDGWQAYYTKWGYGEPANAGNNYGGCVTLNRDGTWNDILCDNSLGAICKYTNEVPVTTPPPRNGMCPGEQYGSTDWNKWHGSCYLFVDDWQSWTRAKEYCVRLDPLASLVTINSLQENEHVYSLDTRYSKNNVWMGLYRSSKTGDFAWTTNEAVIYENWAPGEPNSDGSEECVELYTGNIFPKQWNDASCSSYRAFVCEVPQGHELTPPPHLDGDCPDGWEGYGSNCYLFEATSVVYQDTAQERCEEKGGHLAIIRNDFEMQFIHTEMTNRNEFPVGTSWDYWIGLIKDEDGPEGQLNFKWVDGSEFDQDMYSQWDDGEPNDSGNIEDCVEVYRRPGEGRDGRWNDVECGVARAYVCQIEKELLTSAGLSSGSIVGIVFGVLIVLLLVVGILFAVMNKNCSARCQSGVDSTKKLFKGSGGGIANENYNEFANEKEEA